MSVSIDRSCRSTTWANTRTDPRPARARRPALLRPFVALLLVALLAPAREAGAAIVEEIVAKVNNRIITKSEFEERGQYIIGQVYREHTGADLDRELKNAQDTMLANMVTELLLIERAQSLLDIDKVRKNLVDDFKKQQKIDTDEAMEAMLKEQKMTRKDLEEQLIRLTVPQEVINYEVRRKISVSDRQVKEYYDQHVKEYTTAPTVTLREIVLFYEPVTRTEVEGRAQGVVREFKGGADFVDLVQRYSEAGTRESGGLLDPLRDDELQPEIGRAAFALEVGEISDPIDTGKSFHIVRIEAKTARQVKSVAEVHDVIYNAIREQKFKPRYDAYLKRVWSDAHVEIAPKYENYLIVSPLKPKPGA